MIFNSFFKNFRFLRKNVTIPKTEQIKEILAIYRVDHDALDKKFLSKNKTSEDYCFDDIFSIDEEDVYQYFLKNGWNPNVVIVAGNLPNPNTEDWFYGYIILPVNNSKYHLAHFGSFDRNLWNRWEFASEVEMNRFIIKQLFETQRGFWGKKPTPQELGLCRPDGSAW